MRFFSLLANIATAGLITSGLALPAPSLESETRSLVFHRALPLDEHQAARRNIFLEYAAFSDSLSKAVSDIKNPANNPSALVKKESLGSHAIEDDHKSPEEFSGGMRDLTIPTTPTRKLAALIPAFILGGVGSLLAGIGVLLGGVGQIIPG